MLKLFKSKIILTSFIVSAGLVYWGINNNPNSHFYKKITSLKGYKKVENEEKSQMELPPFEVKTTNGTTARIPSNTDQSGPVASTAFHIIDKKKRLYNENKMEEISQSANLEEVPYDNENL